MIDDLEDKISAAAKVVALSMEPPAIALIPSADTPIARATRAPPQVPSSSTTTAPTVAPAAANIIAYDMGTGLSLIHI